MQIQAQKVAFAGGKSYMYRVYLKDKKGGSYSLRHPEKFLSAKALARRERQGLAVDSTDLPVSSKYIGTLRHDGYQVVGGSRWNNTVLIASPKGDIAPQLEGLNFVTRVVRVFESPDSVSPVKPYGVVKDTTKASESVYGKALPQIAQLNGVKLHEAGFRGKGMTIAIIDGGYMNYTRIPALRGVRVLGCRDFVYPYRDKMEDLLSHGTMVLSCMAAVDSFRYVGTAPEASYYLLRSEYGPTESLMEEDTWAMAAEYADSVGVDVINSSLGYAEFDDATTSHKYVDLDGRRTLISNIDAGPEGRGAGVQRGQLGPRPLEEGDASGRRHRRAHGGGCRQPRPEHGIQLYRSVAGRSREARHHGTGRHGTHLQRSRRQRWRQRHLVCLAHSLRHGGMPLAGAARQDRQGNNHSGA
mgnify:CR=1 FL=1